MTADQIKKDILSKIMPEIERKSDTLARRLKHYGPKARLTLWPIVSVGWEIVGPDTP